MGGHHDTAAYKNTTKDMGVTPTQEAGKKAFKSAAPQPVKTQAAGVNAKSVIPSKHN
jgi:protocatechuate 3,4-dioxygenase beta subunit